MSLNKKYLKSHISNQFNLEIGNTIKLVKKMGELVLKQFKNSIKAVKKDTVVHKDKSLTQRLKVRKHETEISKLCQRIMALRSPVASDLRAVISTLNSTTELERLSHEIYRFAQISEIDIKWEEELIEAIVLFAKEVMENVESAIKAFYTVDSELAVKVILKKKALKKSYEKIINQYDKVREGADLKSVIKFIFGIEALYKISKQSRTLAKNAIYLEEGVDVRFADIEEIKRLVSTS